MGAPVVAKTTTHEGRSIIDSKSSIRFLLGFIAGGAGIDGTVVALGALSYEALLDVLAAEEKDTAFKRRQGESYANQAADMLLTMLGVYVGKHAKEHWEYREALRRVAATQATRDSWPSTPQRRATGLGTSFWLMQTMRGPSGPPVRLTRR